MALRPALVVGMTGLMLVILGIFIFMAVLKIDLQRVSLGRSSSMSVVIMFGLTLGTVITMVLLPTVYSLLFEIRNRDVSEGSNGGTLTPQVA